MMLRVQSLLVFAFAAMASAKFLGFDPATLGDGKSREFNAYWNIPTFMCHKYGLNFTEVSSEFGIRQNTGDTFRGNEIAILYDPGMFPALLKDENGKFIKRNGGVPQRGNLEEHLKLFEKHLIEQVPDEKFDGVGVIDFESWRPIYRQNWASLTPYKDLSVSLVRKEHPSWSNRQVEQEAKEEFEKSGKLFMEKTLKLAQKLRPLAAWGYYAYPYCYNLTPKQPTTQCNRETIKENDKMTPWLFMNEDMLFPSVYMGKKLSQQQRVGLVEGRVREARRISTHMKGTHKILPYFWYRLNDEKDYYLNGNELEAILREMSTLGANGVILWGSSDDFKTREKCENFWGYLMQIFGPAVKSVVERARNGYDNQILYNEEMGNDVNALR
uniref:Hyaluronidase n=1 Tax=Ampulex compressa TaxID=860918 RepID=A0A1W6EVV2_AMPCP|nr:hyaluronidase [Ampulex compressa]